MPADFHGSDRNSAIAVISLIESLDTVRHFLSAHCDYISDFPDGSMVFVSLAKFTSEIHTEI
jgi:hypothetical protein